MIVALGGAAAFRLSRLIAQTYLVRKTWLFSQMRLNLIAVCSMAFLDGVAYWLAATAVGGWLHGPHAGLGLGMSFGLAAAIYGALSAVLWFIEVHTAFPHLDVRYRSFHLAHFLVGAAPLLLVAPSS